ncbi:hypothetical protein [Chitinimonas naiadis]
MALTVVLPDLRFVRQPAFNPAAELALPALATLLGKATQQALPGLGAETWLRDQFNARQAGAARLSMAIDHPNAEEGHWLRADPVYLRPDRDRAILFDASYLQLEQTEADQLVAALNKLYVADGYLFVAATPSRWYLRLPDTPDLQTTSLADVTGQDIHAHLPKGPRALHWHRFLNELQMLLYTQSVNDQREQAGKPAVNSIWLWGEGEALPPAQTVYRHVLADDVLAQGLALAAGVPYAVLPSRLQAEHGDNTLVWLDALSRPAKQGDLHGWRDQLEALERSWFQPLLDAWKAGQIKELTLVLPGSNQTLQATLGGAERWKWWRRPVNIADRLAEPA